MPTLHTITIPLTTVHQATPLVASATIPVGVTWARIDVDRTVGTHSLNSLLAGLALTLMVEISTDGGASWTPDAVTIDGGVIPQGNSNNIIVEGIAGLASSATRQVRGTLTAAQAQVSISGTLTLGN